MLGMLDWAIIAIYFLILLGIVYWTSRRNESTDDYFLAGRNVGWFAIGASLFASNIGSCLLYTSPSPRDKRQSRMPSSA